MKKIKRKILTILLGISVMANPINIRASEQSVQDSVVFIFVIDKASEEVAGGISGVAVEKGGQSWVITASEVSAFSTDDYGFIMLTNGGETTQVYPFTEGGEVAFLYSETPVDLPALPLGTELDVSHELYAVMPSGIEDGQITYGTWEVKDFSGSGTDYILDDGDNLSSLWIGAPIFDMQTATVTGIGTVYKGGMGFKEITEDSYYAELALENWGKLGESQAEEESSADEEETAQEEAEREEAERQEAEREKAEREKAERQEAEREEAEKEKAAEEEPKEVVSEDTEEEESKEADSGEAPEEETSSEPEKEPTFSIQMDENTKWLVILIAVGAVLVLLMNRKKASGNRKGSSSSGSREDSYSMDISEIPEKRQGNRQREELRLQPTEPFAALQKAYQLEGVSGIFAGQRFRIEGVLQIGRDPQSCRVLYSADSKGISRNHCAVELRDGKILLKDLRSSYGTFFENGERLEPEVSYQVQPGTLFYLAERKNMFRITEEGWR